MALAILVAPLLIGFILYDLKKSVQFIVAYPNILRRRGKAVDKRVTEDGMVGRSGVPGRQASLQLCGIICHFPEIAWFGLKIF